MAGKVANLTRIRFSTARVRGAIVALAAVCGLTVGYGAIGAGVDRMIASWSATLRKHPASGKLHIIEIDARSIASIDRWPWVRSEHAKVVDRLRAAGATTIAFDVDFSSRSTEAGDAALAAAIDRADGKVILPTFRQASGGGTDGWIDALPAPALRDRAALAAVSVLPDSDGNVREAPIGTVTDATPRPSLSAMLAGRAGVAGASFPIDYAIDPTTIPRHSFIDIRDGKFDPGALRGRQVLIGATAIELGDRYAVPNYGVIPGVVIQALAAETLSRSIPSRVGWPVALLVGMMLCWLMLRARTRATLATAAIASPAALLGVTVVIQALTGQILQLVPALAALFITTIGALTVRAFGAMQRRRLHDPITGLPNGPALISRLRVANGGAVVVARIANYEKLAAGLPAGATARLVMRVCDRIKLVSPDANIHRINDRMLAWVATVHFDDAGDRFEKLRAVMLSPLEVDGRRIDVSLTVGVAEGDGEQASKVIAHAALAAEQAHADQTGWHLHESAEAEAVDRELSLLGELDEAVLSGDLIVHYQPKLAITEGVVTSVEALVRWQHPIRGFLRPDLFIPLAERNDRIAGLTLFVIERSIGDLLEWSAKGHDVSVAVNLSAKLLASPVFNTKLMSLIQRTNVPPNRLIFEVTESVAMTDPAGAIKALQRFREIGIAISMDDYGTGQSTLSYLKQLPLNELKIDRSFVQAAHQNRGDAILVRSTVDLAHELGLRVVAEGVETVECLDYLHEIGCDYAQGYLIGKPSSSEDVLQLIRHPRTHVSPVLEAC